MKESDLIRKLRLISKFMALQTEYQIISIHIFPDTSGSKGIQSMNFGQLIEYNVRYIFSSKIIQKMGQGN